MTFMTVFCIYGSMWIYQKIEIILLVANKGIWKQDPEANILAQGRWEWEMEKALQWETS